MKNMVKEVMEQLKVDGVKFTVKGFEDYRRKEEFDTTKPEIEVGEYNYFPQVFEVSKFGEDNFSIREVFEVSKFGEDNFSIRGGLRQMNVEKYGPTCVWLYTFDMLEKKTKGKIKYTDVALLEKA